MSEVIDRQILRRYEILQRLGRGAYGVVWKAQDKKRKTVIAVKKIFDAFQNRTDSQRTFREVSFLEKLQHENVIKLIRVHKAFNDRDIYLVFEYMETDLHSAIRAKILAPIHQRYIIYQLLKCLKYLHSAKLLHRDMKPSNLLLNSDCEVKVCDFGLARILDSSSDDKTNSKNQQILTDYVATRWYRAPEILLGSNHYTRGVDMWAVGCILGEMAVGSPLFPGISTMDQLDHIVKVTGYPTDEEIRSIRSPFAVTMLGSIKKVISTKSIRDSFPILEEDSADLLRNLLQFNPNKRLSAEQALDHRYVAEFHDPINETVASRPISTKFDDNKRLSVDAYRDELYRRIIAKKRENKSRGPRRRRNREKDEVKKESKEKRRHREHEKRRRKSHRSSHYSAQDGRHDEKDEIPKQEERRFRRCSSYATSHSESKSKLRRSKSYYRH